MEKFVAVPLLSEINHSLDKLLERGDSDTDILSYGVPFCLELAKLNLIINHSSTAHFLAKMMVENDSWK